MARVERLIREKDRHFARLVAPIVGMAGQIQELANQHEVLYMGVDRMLKHFEPEGGGLAALEKEREKRPAAGGERS